MSHDIRLKDPVTGETLLSQERHQMAGGTFAAGGTRCLELNVTYNYTAILNRVIIGGIRLIYGATGAESIIPLTEAIEQLGDDVDDDYWKATEGNVKQALCQLRSMAQMRPDGVWDGD